MLTVIVAVLLLLSACRDVPVVESPQQPVDPLKESRINANRLVAQSEENQIDAYVARRGWTMERLMGGGRLLVTREGTGRQLDYEETVSICYSIETLGGQNIYCNVADTVTVGHLQPTRGIDEALRKLKHGSSARIILPSEQAYGVVGDGNKIGSRMVLVYDLEIE